MPSTSGKFHGVIDADQADRDPLGQREPARVAGRQHLAGGAGGQRRRPRSARWRGADLVVGLAADAAGLPHDQLAEGLGPVGQRGGDGAQQRRRARRRSARPSPAGPLWPRRRRRPRRPRRPGPAVAKISPDALSRTPSVPPPAGVRKSPATNTAPCQACWTDATHSPHRSAMPRYPGAARSRQALSLRRTYPTRVRARGVQAAQPRARRAAQAAEPAHTRRRHQRPRTASGQRGVAGLARARRGRCCPAG